MSLITDLVINYNENVRLPIGITETLKLPLQPSVKEIDVATLFDNNLSLDARNEYDGAKGITTREMFNGRLSDCQSNRRIFCK